VSGLWSLQITDGEHILRKAGPAGTWEQSHGRGALADWLLLITDYANNLRVYYMDITASVDVLPKYGYLHVEEKQQSPSPWSTIFSGRKAVEPLAAGLDYNLVGACSGVDTTGLQGVRSGEPYRYCYQNFGVGPALPPKSRTRSAFNFVENQRIVYYRPRENFLGSDSFSYRILSGVNVSSTAGTVRVNVRNCRDPSAKDKSPQIIQPLCDCRRGDWRSPLGHPEECASAVLRVCSDLSIRWVFARLCNLCSVPFSADCRTELDRSGALLEARGMCDASPRLLDCQMESFALPARESSISGGLTRPTDLLTPLDNANEGQGFMWSPHLA
jgi:hypothetical protein